MEFDPGGKSGRSGQAGGSPAWFDAEPARKWNGAEISQSRGEKHPQHCEAKWSPRVAERIVGGCVESSQCGREKADSRSREDSPNIGAVCRTEATGLKEGAGNHVPEGEEGHGTGHHEECNASKTAIEAPPKKFMYARVLTNSTRHLGQFRGRHRHAEQAYGQRVKDLGVGQSRHCTAGQ